MTIVLSQVWGTEKRNNRCREYVFEYIKTIEEIVRKGIEKGEITQGNPEIIASRNICINMFLLNI